MSRDSLTAVTFNNQHEFAVMKYQDGRMAASYVLAGGDPPPESERPDLQHKLNCLFGEEVKVYWHPNDILQDMRRGVLFVSEALSSLGIDPTSQRASLN